MDDPPAPVIIDRIELTPWINRLEAATSRLEDMASSVGDAPKTNGASPTVSAPTAAAAVRPQPVTPQKVAEPLPQTVEDFDAFIDTAVKKYVDRSNEIGGPVAEQVQDRVSPLSGS